MTPWPSGRSGSGRVPSQAGRANGDTVVVVVAAVEAGATGADVGGGLVVVVGAGACSDATGSDSAEAHADSASNATVGMISRHITTVTVLRTDRESGDTLFLMHPDDSQLPLDAPGAGRRRLALIAPLALIVIWLALGVVQLVEARNHARSGLAGLDSIRGELDIDSVTEGSLIAPLAASWDEFRSAGQRIRSPLVTPLRLIPWVRTQVQSAEALSTSATAVTGAFTAAATDIANLAGVADAPSRAAVATKTLAVVRRTQAALSTVDLGPSRMLLGSLADGRARFAAEVADATELLEDAEQAAAGLAEFLEGPTTYLLLAANNAEMRAGSGSYLQVGLVRVAGGAVEVEELRPAPDILVERGAVTVADPDLEARWGWLDMAVDWRNLSASPRFPASAAVAADMWAALEGDVVDGVMVLDPVGLATLVDAAGPVDLEGRRISADRVVRELLFDQYWEDDVSERRDRLAEIARAALAGIEDAGIDFVTLARELRTVAAARHVLAWSRSPTQQQAWETVGVSGTLTPDSLSVAILNRGANKLDPFLDITADLDIRPVGNDYEVELRLTIENLAQTVFPSYVLGPAAAFGYEPGSYVGILSVNLPGVAVGARFDGVSSLAVEGTDGETRVAAVHIEIAAGETLEHELTFALPGPERRLHIEPSARVPGITWTAGDTAWTDSSSVILDLAGGEVTGDAIRRPAEPVSFELDPIRNPAAPLPAVAFDAEVETTVEVSWQPLQDDAVVDIWEKPGIGDWERVGAGIATAPLSLPDRPRNTELCYRTALSITPSQFSAVECLTIPDAVGYMRFDGDPSAYFVAPDFVGTGPLDVRALVAPDRWVPDYWQMFAGQYDSAGNDRAWRFGIDVFDALVANFSEDGVSDLGSNGFVPASFRDGTRQWVRVTIDPRAGEQRFWTSPGGRNWSVVGDVRRFEPFESLHDSRGPVFVGADRTGTDNPFSGKLYYLEVRRGIDGPVIANLDFRTLDQRGETDGSWTDDFGNVFEGVGTAWQYVPPEG